MGSSGKAPCGGLGAEASIAPGFRVFEHPQHITFLAILYTEGIHKELTSSNDLRKEEFCLFLSFPTLK